MGSEPFVSRPAVRYHACVRPRRGGEYCFISGDFLLELPDGGLVSVMNVEWPEYIYLRGWGEFERYICEAAAWQADEVEERLKLRRELLARGHRGLAGDVEELEARLEALREGRVVLIMERLADEEGGAVERGETVIRCRRAKPL